MGSARLTKRTVQPVKDCFGLLYTSFYFVRNGQMNGRPDMVKALLVASSNPQRNTFKLVDVGVEIEPCCCYAKAVLLLSECRSFEQRCRAFKRGALALSRHASGSKNGFDSGGFG